jgi:hypothetical protein
MANGAYRSIASYPPRAKIHRCLVLSESDRITDLAALPYTLTHSESWNRFKAWWLVWGLLSSGKIARGLP